MIFNSFLGIYWFIYFSLSLFNVCCWWLVLYIAGWSIPFIFNPYWFRYFCECLFILLSWFKFTCWVLLFFNCNFSMLWLCWNILIEILIIFYEYIFFLLNLPMRILVVSYLYVDISLSWTIYVAAVNIVFIDLSIGVLFNLISENK